MILCSNGVDNAVPDLGTGGPSEALLEQGMVKMILIDLMLSIPAGQDGACLAFFSSPLFVQPSPLLPNFNLSNGFHNMAFWLAGWFVLLLFPEKKMQ